MATATRIAEVDIAERRTPLETYVDWSAIFAGAAVATAISVTLIAFGSALGLSLTSFANRSSMPGLGIVIAIGLWLLWLQITASIGGGYIAGRLRRRINDAPSHEVGMRDGMHGLVVWAVGALIGSMFVAWIATLGSMGAAAVASSAASNPQASSVLTDYYVDRLLRKVTEATTNANPPAGAAQSGTIPGAQTISPDLRSEIGRLLMTGRVTTADSEDRAYLLRRLEEGTGLPDQAASERLDTTLAMMKAHADQVRRMSVLMAFITAVSLLISAVAAWWAAAKGGEHRDQQVDHSKYVTFR